MRCPVWWSLVLVVYTVYTFGGHVGGVTVYDYFTEGGITQGLTARGQEFQLNGKDIRILSGSLHYFRNRLKLHAKMFP